MPISLTNFLKKLFVVMADFAEKLLASHFYINLQISDFFLPYHSWSCHFTWDIEFIKIGENCDMNIIHMWDFATGSYNLYENLNVMYIKTSYCVQVENVQFLYKGCQTDLF